VDAQSGEQVDETVVVLRRAEASAPVTGPDVDETIALWRGTARAEPPVLVDPPALDTPAEVVKRFAAPESVESTAWHRFRIGQAIVGLDAVTLVGRKPSAPRIADGRTPRLVRVPSPNREVSGTHVELRQSGATVVVTDLRSTNGTVVMIPRRRPRTLRQGESVVVTPGTLVDIGDGNVIEILPMNLPASGSGVRQEEQK